MLNGTLIQYFHWYYPADHSLWKKLKQDAPYLESLGFHSAWLPPVYKGIHGDQSIGYDTYDLFDLGEFDQKGSISTKYGTKQELIDAIKTAQERGIAIYMDVVVNHKGGADEKEKVKAVKVDPQNRNEIISAPHEIESYTKFFFPGRNGKYSTYVWDFHSFTGVDYDASKNESGVYKLLNEYGNDWENVPSEEMGNFDYLMHADIEFRNPNVTGELKYWIKWFYETLHFDGLRLDAIKHITPDFFNEWLEYIEHEPAIDKPMFVVGEYWETSNVQLLLDYLAATNERIALFDAILQHRFHVASKGGKDFDLSKLFEDTLVSTRPDKAVTLVANHDTQPLQSLEAPVEPWFKPLAYAAILLRKDGYPCVFYPDLFGADYTDKGGDGKEYHISMPKVDKIELLLQARQRFAYGDQTDIFDHANCIGWVRHGDAEHENSGCVVLICNGDDGYKDIDMGKDKAGTVYIDFLGNRTEEVKINNNGAGRFLVRGGSVSVWVRK